MGINRSLKFVLLAYVLISVIITNPANATSIFSRPVFDIIDTNADPRIFEASISIDEQDALISGTIVHTIIYKDDNQPGKYTGVPSLTQLTPQIEVKVGDEVIVHFTNKLEPNCAAIDCDSSIHWHGIEVDNDSDGTGVTQNHLLPGEKYTYRFRVPRPGLFWFHPHMNPSPQVFAGTYGIFIAKDPSEAALQNNHTIPSQANTYSIVLSDIEFDAIADDSDVGNVGYIDATTQEAVPWRTLRDACAAGSTPDCNKFKDAATVLINGGPPTATLPTIKAKSGSGIRLRLLNSSTIRYFRLQVTNNGADNNLYRIGGEGGFLEFTRLEGGTLGTWNTGYNKGEIVLAPGQRADVVLVPTGNDGDTITFKYPPYNRGAFAPSSGPDMLFVTIDNSISDSPFSIAEGTPILGPGGVEDIKGVPIVDFFETPYPISGHPETPIGTTDQTIHFQAIGSGMTTIDGFIGMLDDSGPDYTMVMYGGASRYLNVRDTIEYTVQNLTKQHHPYHQHGFSFQPVRVVDNANNTLYNFNYNEFIDDIDVFQGQNVVLRMRLDDRSRITDTRQEPDAPIPDQKFPRGGAIGRWVFHCHIFLHAATGMMAEFVVRDDECNTDSDCTGGDVCTTGTCDTNLHQCSYAPIPNCCQSDADCDCNDICTIDKCIQERCEHRIIEDCRDSHEDDDDESAGVDGGGDGGFLVGPPLMIPTVPPPPLVPVAETAATVSTEDSVTGNGATDQTLATPESPEVEQAPLPKLANGAGCSTTSATEHSVFIAALTLWLLQRRRRITIES